MDKFKCPNNIGGSRWSALLSWLTLLGLLNPQLVLVMGLDFPESLISTFPIEAGDRLGIEFKKDAPLVIYGGPLCLINASMPGLGKFIEFKTPLNPVLYPDIPEWVGALGGVVNIVYTYIAHMYMYVDGIV